MLNFLPRLIWSYLLSSSSSFLPGYAILSYNPESPMKTMSSLFLLWKDSLHVFYRVEDSHMFWCLHLKRPESSILKCSFETDYIQCLLDEARICVIHTVMKPIKKPGSAVNQERFGPFYACPGKWKAKILQQSALIQASYPNNWKKTTEASGQIKTTNSTAF